MRVEINLSSQPFRNNRGLILGSSVLALILTGTLIMLISLARADYKNKQESARQLAVAEKQLAGLKREQALVDRELRRPENEAVLERSVLLNDILLRKGISWTRIFGDLEKVLPYNVRILQIRPQLDANNHIFLQMVLAADKTEQLNDCVQKLEASDVFGATMVTSIIPPSQTDPVFRYQVSVSYAQKL